MAWSGGTFTRLWTWVSDSITYPNILASRFDTYLLDMANGINNCLTKDGQNNATADLPMGGFKHTGVANGSARTHYASLGQLQDSGAIWGGTSTGAANTYAITLSPAITSYATGLTLSFNAHQANTGAVTLAVNGLATKAITKNGTTPLAADDIGNGKVISVVYDGTQFQLVTSFAINEYADSAFRVIGSADATKKLALEVDGITTGTTRTLTVQDVSGTILVTGGADVAIADGGTGASTAASGFDNLKQAATETYAGVVELATVAEVQTGTDTTRAVTPKGLSDSSLGMAQTYQNVTGSRVSGTTYTNNTGRPIFVVVQGIPGGGVQITASVGGVSFLVASSGSSAGSIPVGSFIVPNGATYSATFTSGLSTWHELR